jgi:ABC-type lipoprotein release transport system permease subunit
MRIAALWAVTRSELRYRWRSWLALAMLAAVVCGVVMGAAAAGRRTASAFPRYDATYGYDVFVYGFGPVPKLASLPEVTSSTQFGAPANGPAACACPHPFSQTNFGLTEPPSPLPPDVFKLLGGRLPSRPDEVLASFNFARDEGIHIGSVVRVPFYSPSQVPGIIANTAGPPAGPTVAFRVVGIEASEGDFPSVGNVSYSLVSSPAFDRIYNPQIALFYGYTVRLRHGGADVPRFDQEVIAPAIGGAGTTDTAQVKVSTQAAIHPQAVGWWVLAVLAGIAALVVVGQALSRQSNVEADEYATLAALGMGPKDLFALSLGRALLVGVTGALGAVLLAFVLSPIAPVGEARVAEPATGFQFDAVVLGLGALAVVVVVLLLSLWPAYRTSRLIRVARGRAERPSQVVARLAAAGAPPSTVIGVRRALDPGRGRESVPVGSALGGAVLAVAALCATAVFGGSLTHLVASPPLYGQVFQVWFNGFNSPDSYSSVDAALHHDRAVHAVTLGLSSPVLINGVPTHSIAGRSLQGPLLIASASGRLPRGRGEVALGSTTLRAAHAHVGGTVRMTFPLQAGGSRTVTATVVGTAPFPPDFGVVGLGTGAYMTYDGFVSAQCPRGPASPATDALPSSPFAVCVATVTNSPVLLVGTSTGGAGRAAVARYAQQYPGLAYLPVKPDNLVNFGQAVNFPLILGFVLVLFGLATLLHVLVVSVARRRRELGLLKAIGLLRHQVVAAVCWQATTIALVGLVVGLPLGVIVGRAIWHAFGVNIGVVPVTVVETSTLVLLAVGVLVVANALAIGPALVSARQKPNSLLRTE